MAMVRFMILRCTLRGVAHFASLVGEVWGGECHSLRSWGLCRFAAVDTGKRRIGAVHRLCNDDKNALRVGATNNDKAKRCHYYQVGNNIDILSLTF